MRSRFGKHQNAMVGDGIRTIGKSNPTIHGSLLGSPFWEHKKEIFNPETSPGAEPWVYSTIYVFFVFLFNIFDIVSFFLTLCSTIHLCAARQYFYNIYF